ncbi:rhodanese-like domain-containing protein [Xanthovirga aplysinae]|uniref:rhodanese-like domain-containing protein n=1 Tax=Xanthovirga aplysinae TaxID=2529853 RepID=UPI0012BC15E4|nr:rhodanese-like domain-containing protein [Xanthovirga aplysinae]MTI32123.1 rhodanese-like domain-containing protein [Xanthovirga aplysinae]
MLKNICILFHLMVLTYFPAIGPRNFEKMVDSIYQNSVPLVQAGDLNRQLIREDKIIILDTRSIKEFKVSHLDNAIFIDNAAFSIDQVDTIPKSTKIIVYCSVGYRSELIGKELINAGYQNVYNLYGGIFEWKNEGFTVVNQKGQPTDSVHTFNKNWSKWLIKGKKIY